MSDLDAGLLDLDSGFLQSDGFEFNTLLPVIGLSAFMFVVCMATFGIAVHRGMNRLFAPRSWARPKQVSAMLYTICFFKIVFQQDS
jgi:hypothetical protein